MLEVQLVVACLIPSRLNEHQHVLRKVFMMLLQAFICACQDCFKAAGASLTMGNLKHKDLQGQEVASQVPVSCAALPP